MEVWTSKLSHLGRVVSKFDAETEKTQSPMACETSQCTGKSARVSDRAERSTAKDSANKHVRAMLLDEFNQPNMCELHLKKAALPGAAASAGCCRRFISLLATGAASNNNLKKCVCVCVCEREKSGRRENN